MYLQVLVFRSLSFLIICHKKWCEISRLTTEPWFIRWWYMYVSLWYNRRKWLCVSASSLFFNQSQPNVLVSCHHGNAFCHRCYQRTVFSMLTFLCSQSEKCKVMRMLKMSKYFCLQLYLSAVSSPCLALWGSGGLQGLEMHTWLLSGRRTDSKQQGTKTKHKSVGCCRGVFVLSFRRTEDRSRCQTWLWGTAESRRRRRSRGMSCGGGGGASAAHGWVLSAFRTPCLDSAFLFQKGFWCLFFLSENRRGRRKCSEAGSGDGSSEVGCFLWKGEGAHTCGCGYAHSHEASAVDLMSVCDRSIHVDSYNALVSLAVLSLRLWFSFFLLLLLLCLSQLSVSRGIQVYSGTSGVNFSHLGSQLVQTQLSDGISSS